MPADHKPIKGRGAVSAPEGRFESLRRESFDDGWEREEAPVVSLETIVKAEHARSIISHNDSPDIPFSQSINPYRGCEHGCIYCYARPTHSYLNLSPGLDFETKLFFKENAAELLEQELSKPGYKPSMIALGASTDPYQPIERQHRITRSILEVLLKFRHPVGITTKGVLVARDVDLLAEMAKLDLVQVAMSITSLKPELKRTLEPRTASPQARLRVVRELSAAGVPAMVMFSPVSPFINDAEMESVLEAAREAGARGAGFTMLRLPWEVKDLFVEWLAAHAPLKADHVMSLVQQMRGGKAYDSEWGTRMRGTGQYARIIEKRFDLACRRLGLNEDRWKADHSHFVVPPKAGDQISLFS